MLSLIVALAAFGLLELVLRFVRRGVESPTAIVPSCAWRTKAPAFEPPHHKSSSEQNLGKVLAYLSELYKIRLNAGERFFVKTGLSPYYHLCVDDFIPMPCPACEWSKCNFGLIEWRREALLGLADKLEFERSTSPVVPNRALPKSALRDSRP